MARECITHHICDCYAERLSQAESLLKDVQKLIGQLHYQRVDMGSVYRLDGDIYTFFHPEPTEGRTSRGNT